MRIFISEYVCSGAWDEPAMPESLAREGRAMLLGLLGDAARESQWRIHTTWDDRLGGFPLGNVSATIVRDPSVEQHEFDRLTVECDATYVIAPELGDLLGLRCQRVVEAGGSSLNASAEALAACSDKLALARRLEEDGIPTVPTRLLNDVIGRLEFPVVVKPRFGAGSQNTFLVRSESQFDNVRSKFADAPDLSQGIVQPFVAAMPISIAAFVDGQGRVRNLGPVVEQLLSNDGRFTYLGGRVPAKINCTEAVADLARKVVATVSGLCGFVGIDMLLPYGRPEPTIIEVNPRLTTSYIGYRALTGENLARRILEPDQATGRIVWTADHLLFTSHGTVNRA